MNGAWQHDPWTPFKTGSDQPNSCVRKHVIELGEKAAGWTVLKIEGPVRLAETEELLQHARTLEADGGGLELDLGSAEHIHAAGLQILRALEQHCEAQHRPFRLGAVSDKASDALALCGLGHWLESARNTEHGS